MNLPLCGRAPDYFKLQGQIYYQINKALYPSENMDPCYGHLFVIDPRKAIDFRMQNNSGTDVEILQCLESIMREHNIFARSYMMKQEISHWRDISGNTTEPEMELLFTLKSGYDKNRYNF